MVSLGHAVCPRCGLRVEIIDLGEQISFRYDFLKWDRLCQSPLQGGPSACLAADRQATMGDDGS